jgi:hypothetical protein
MTAEDDVFYQRGRRAGLREALELAMKIVDSLPIPEPRRGARIIEAELLRILESEVTNGYTLPRRASVGVTRGASKDRAASERLPNGSTGVGKQPTCVGVSGRNRKYTNPRRISVG